MYSLMKGDGQECNTRHSLFARDCCCSFSGIPVADLLNLRRQSADEHACLRP
jgi:hypothetical protein